MTRFIKFIAGGFLIIGSLVFGIGLIFSLPFAMIADQSTALWIWIVIDIFAFLTGVFLVRP